MRCLDDCHYYELDNFIQSEPPIYIQFYKMALTGIKTPGTTNEEVIKALIHRIDYLNNIWLDGKFNCDENSRAIEHLKLALDYLEQRTYDRVTKQVEGTHKP